MRCEACGYQFLLASSTKCPDCGDLREAIVKESDIQAAMGHANALTNHSVIGKRPFDHDPAVVTVTDEMIAAGKNIECSYCEADDGSNDRDYFSRLYRVMAAVAPQDPPQIPIMDSVVGLKAANAHLTRRVAELEAAPMVIKSLEGRIEELQSYSHAMAMNLDERNAKDQETEAYQYLKRLFLHMAPQCCVLPDLLGVCTQVDNAIAGLKIDNAELTRQFAAQALAHAEQMEGAQRRIAGLETQVSMQDSIYADRPGTLFSARQKIATERDVALARVAELEMQDRAWTRIVDQQQTDIERVREDYNYEVCRGNEWFVKYNELKAQLAMRVTPSTQPTDTQQTASDVKTTQEPKAFPAGALKTGGSDPRRMGPQ